MEPIQDLPFEMAVAELESVVALLEGDSLTLDETVTLYERGRALAAHCQTLLDGASLKVEQLTRAASGEDVAVPLSVEPAG